jgi:hypothetical protein
MPEATQSRTGSSWPFRAAPQHHDMQISEQGVGVPGRQEVLFKDGNRIWLTRVMKNGTPDLFLRDLGAPVAGRASTCAA